MADTPKPRAPRQPAKLANPAKILREPGEGGKEYVMRGKGKHYPPGGGSTFTSEHKERFNYHNTAEFGAAMEARKANRKQKLAARDQNPGFTASTPAGSTRTTVSWQGKGSSNTESPKTSAAKTHAVAMTSQSVKDSITASQGHSATPRQTGQPKERNPRGVAGGRFPNRSEQAATHRAENATTRPNPKLGYDYVPSQTKAQPAAPSKSFDTHADEAVAMGNSGRSRPASQSAQVPGRSQAKASIPSPFSSWPKVSATEAPTPNRNISDSQFVSTRKQGSAEVRGKVAAKREADRSGVPSRATSSRFVESGNVDAVSGLEPSRAARKAVKAGRKLDVAERGHAARSNNRRRMSNNLQDVRDETKSHGPVARLLTGSSKPENTIGPVAHAARQGALRAGQKFDNHQLLKAQGKYDKARSKAESVHDAIRAGTRRGSNSDIGAVAGSAGRAVGRVAKGAAHAVAETVKGDINAVKLAHKEITGDTPTGRRIDAAWEKRQQSQGPTGGRAPKPQGQPNRNVSPRQFSEPIHPDIQETINRRQKLMD